jgi:hypothetical protein
MILGNDVLLSLATEPPPRCGHRQRQKGVNERMLEKHGRAHTCGGEERAIDLPKEQWPRLERPKRWDRDNDYEERLKRLKIVRDTG